MRLCNIVGLSDTLHAFTLKANIVRALKVQLGEHALPAATQVRRAAHAGSSECSKVVSFKTIAKIHQEVIGSLLSDTVSNSGLLDFLADVKSSSAFLMQHVLLTFWVIGCGAG